MALSDKEISASGIGVYQTAADARKLRHHRRSAMFAENKKGRLFAESAPTALHCSLVS